MRRASLALLLCGCAGVQSLQLPRLTAQRRADTPFGHFVVHHEPSVVSDANQTLDAVRAAAPKLARWGTLKVPVTIDLLPSHAELERVVHRRGYSWLRAWARYDEVLLQTPSSWNAGDADLTELLAHELTHCLMFQRAATGNDWAGKNIPLWFREGMASWTAEQGARWLSLEDLARFWSQGPDDDPLVHAEEMYQTRSAVVYAAAHYAFTFLVSRYGTRGVEAVLDEMAKGASFHDAFERALKVGDTAFLVDFRHYVLWRGFRGDGKVKP